MHIETLESKVREVHPNIKDTSVRAYALSLKAIVPPVAEDFSDLYQVSAVLSKLENYKDTTRKNILNAAVVVLKNDDQGQEAFKVYEKERDKYNENYQNLMKDHTKTESQEKNWVDWPDYVTMVEKMKRETTSLKSTQTWTMADKMKFQDYLVALLYQNYPLRNDFVAKLIGKREYNRLTDDDTRETNYVATNGSSFTLVINEYKTSQKYGRKEIPMDDGQVKRALRKWFRHNDSGSLLINSHNKPMQANGVSKLLTRVGQQRLGRYLGSSLLRHSYLSHKYKAVTLEKQKDADLMMHSEAMQQAYIK